MNILKIYPYPDFKAGSERSMHVGTSGLRAQGHKVFLLHAMPSTPETAAEYDGSVGAPVVFDTRSKFPPLGLRAAEQTVEEFIELNCIDILHVHGYPRVRTLRRWARNHRVVVTVHVPICPNGSRYLWTPRRPCERNIGIGCLTTGYRKLGCGHLGNELPQRLPGFLRGMIDDFRLRNAISRCSRVIAPSEWMRGRLGQDNIPATTLRVVHEAIAGWDMANWIAPEKLPIILYIGRLVDFKGPDQLLRASALVDRPHRLWFVGDGPMRERLEGLVSELGLNDRVTLFGSMPADDIRDYRIRCTLVVVPSLWQDNFPMVGPETMLMRRPVIAYRVGGIPEWLKDGETGYLVEPGDVRGLAVAIEKVLSDPEAARAMGDSGRLAALEWTPGEHATKLLEVYREAMSADQVPA